MPPSPPGVGLEGRCLLLLVERPAVAAEVRRPLPLCVDKRKEIKISLFVYMAHKSKAWSYIEQVVLNFHDFLRWTL